MVDKEYSLIHTLEGKKRPNEETEKRFSFSNFSKAFDQHIDQSIRCYSLLRQDVVSMSCYFIENDTYVLDLGCSQGSLLRAMYERNDHACTAQYLGVEINQHFAPHWQPADRLSYTVDDITTMPFPREVSLVTSLFTLQFIPERKRITVLQKIFDSLIEGGGFVFSEKLLSADAKVQNMMDFMYYDYKRQHFTEKQILDKEVELRHLAKLTNEQLLIQQLTDIGFSCIQSFWRNFNFTGMIAIKPAAQ